MASSPVHVSGFQIEEEHGIEEAMTEFRLHHARVGASLLNISGVGTPDGKPQGKDKPRMAYDPANHPFPKMVFHAEKGELVVQNQVELDGALSSNFRLEPYAKPVVAMLDPKAEKLALEAKLKHQEGIVTSQNDMLQKLAAKVEALEKKKN